MLGIEYQLNYLIKWSIAKEKNGKILLWKLFAVL